MVRGLRDLVRMMTVVIRHGSHATRKRVHMEMKGVG